MENTERLNFIPFDFKQTENLMEIFGDKEIMKYSVEGTKSVAEVEEFIKESQYGLKNNLGWWALYLKDTNEFVGVCGYFSFIYADKEEAKIAYRLKKDFWGRGLASEAASQLIKTAFLEHKREKIFATVDKRNEGSIKVLQKAGMKEVEEYDYFGRRALLFMEERNEYLKRL